MAAPEPIPCVVPVQAPLAGKRPKRNYVGLPFGSLIVIDQEYRHGRAWVTALCACGNTWAGTPNALVAGLTQSCGHLCGLKPKGILRQEVSLDGTLWCQYCHQPKPAGEFRKKRGARCLACWNAYQRAWSAQNPEKKHAAANAYAARQWAEQPELMLAKRRQWRQENPEKDRITARARYAANPEPVKAQKKESEVRRRARKHGVLFEQFTRSEIYERDRWICQICHRKVEKHLKFPHLQSPSLDHVIPLADGGAHTRRNCVLAHLQCNTRKGARRIAQQQRLF